MVHSSFASAIVRGQVMLNHPLKANFANIA